MAAKLQQVTQLLGTLKKDLQEKQLSSAREFSDKVVAIRLRLMYESVPAEKVQTLLQLRQYGTNPVDAGPIYCSDVR
jgi:hypothetical protein